MPYTRKSEKESGGKIGKSRTRKNSRTPRISERESSRARMGGRSPCVITRTWGKHLHLPRAVSARSVHALGRTPPQSKALNEKAEATRQTHQ
mgnify:CR=1 FL=1